MASSRHWSEKSASLPAKGDKEGRGTKNPRSDWMGAGGDGLREPVLKRADVLKKEETRQAVSSIRSKLSAPKSDKVSLEDKRKHKLGSFSASLTREEIVNSQERHREKMEAYGKPVPAYQQPREGEQPR
mmetsp:Transcript_51581/g.85540  ORF Transcript_51581/g.85540 Transcript_51581/m.85540 type:complete len:129 (-) Transcript_51581:295-681(-)|eukprot:CAMPEP_0119309836 /NCGR_PEP_ID=MMETSP1333-20130426/17072_1 /TAXON_ID=418940 /ORGANISM="Scyphosphaera apsteinii, Strain RCC1455" /LENGTH=128 /DNA_ID=CAMNT_0007313889 /DNA_START=26 /DNA_END=412 /DNA_ORIENTATION=+